VVDIEEEALSVYFMYFECTRGALMLDGLKVPPQ
jgi:hypothetical protein